MFLLQAQQHRKNELNASEGNDPNSILMNSISPFFVSLTSNIATNYSGTGTTTGQVNPLVKMKNVGDYTLVAAEGTLTAYTILRAVVAGESSLLGKVVNMTGAISAVDKGLDAISPAVYFFVITYV